MSNIGLSTDLVLANTSVRPGTLVLPLSTQIPGRTITIKCATGSCAVSTCFISTSGGETFEDGSTTQALTTSYGFIKVSARAGKWYTGATTQPNSYAANTINAATTQATAISTAAMNTTSLSLGSTNALYTSSSLAYWGPYLLNSGFRTAQPQIFFALAKLMSQVYTLSTYSLANIANAVTSLSATPAYIWTISVPSGAKGKNGILAVYFNLFGNFLSSQSFDYAVYVDGVSQFQGDLGTMRYVQTSAGQYAISNGGISLGLNGILCGQPLFIPLTLSASASQIQIGIKNSSAAMTPVAAYSPVNASATTLTTTGTTTYTVPSTAGGQAVTGVYLYAWGAGGMVNFVSNAGGGGFTSGFYSCSPGTVFSCVVGAINGSQAPASGGSGGGWNDELGGGFSGVFLSNVGGLSQSTALIIAGGGACASRLGSGGAGGAGAYTTNATGVGYSGGVSWIYSSNAYGNPGVTVAGPGTLAAGGTSIAGDRGAYNASYNGGALYGGGPSNGIGGGGGYFGGAGIPDTGTSTPGGGGGSSYAVNTVVSPYFEPGTTATSSGATTTFPGGVTNSYYSSPYGRGNSTGLVVVVPAIGVVPTQVGVSATLFTA
jgi:hypothetical protein